MGRADGPSFSIFRTRITTCFIVIELRLALISYQDDHMLLLISQAPAAYGRTHCRGTPRPSRVASLRCPGSTSVGSRPVEAHHSAPLLAMARYTAARRAMVLITRPCPPPISHAAGSAASQCGLVGERHEAKAKKYLVAHSAGWILGMGGSEAMALACVTLAQTRTVDPWYNPNTSAAEKKDMCKGPGTFSSHPLSLLY